MNSATVLGAGLAGSLLAINLRQRGFKVELYEKRSESRNESATSGRSINLALSARGIRALREVDLFKALEPSLLPMRGRELHPLDGESQFQPYSWKEEDFIYSVSRSHLNEVLLSRAEEAGVKIHFEKEIVEVDLQTKKLFFQDLTTKNYELLFSADGAGSLVRNAIHQTKEKETRVDWLDHSYKELTIPPSKDGDFLLRKDALHIWPRGGFMLIALPNPTKDFTVTLFLGNNDFNKLDSKEAVRSFFEEYFRDVLELIPDLEDQFIKNPTGRLGTVRSETWHYKDHSLILGDAAHAIVPFHGQGMNAAFEDVYLLNEALKKAAPSESFFKAYEAERLPNASAIAEMALENYITMRDSVRDPKFHLKKKVEFALEKKIPTHFIPRYSMVMFHNIPYAEAFTRGEVQNNLLDQIVKNKTTLNEINLDDWQETITKTLPKLSTL